MSDDTYENTQEDELRRRNTLAGSFADDSLSLSLPTETVQNLLCTSPSRAIPCITDSDVARNIDSQRLEAERREESQIVIEDDEFFLDVPTGQAGTSTGLADALISRITTEEPKWEMASPEASNPTYLPSSDYAVTYEPYTPYGISQPTTSNESDAQATYNFDVIVEATAKKKTSDYVYNASENCLFAKPFVFVPFEVSCSVPPPAGSCVRVCAFYSQGAHASQPVRRCPHHLSSDESETREHFIIAESAYVAYIQPRWAGERPHLTVPYPVASEPPFIPLQFKCYSSCTGGVNRRALVLCFTLEANGEVMGTKKVTLKVCACPSRDAAADGFEPPPKKRRTVIVPQPTEVVTKAEEPSGSAFHEDDETIYELQIRGRHLYKLVCSIVHNYELSRRYMREKDGDAIQVSQLPKRTRPLSHRTSIASWLAGLDMSKYEKLFHTKSLHVLDDLEGVINKKFLQSVGVGAADISTLLSSYLSWFDVYNAQRLSTLSSVGSTIRVQRTRLRSTFREPY